MTLPTSVEALVWMVALTTGVWVLSLLREDAGVVDIFWGVAFLVAVWVYYDAAEMMTPRRTIVVVLVHLWALRLSLHLLWRNWGKPEDRRYRAMRERAGSNFWWRSLFVVFWLQAAIAWVISMPLHAAIAASAPAALQPFDWLGILLFATGFVFEAVGDWQLMRFRADPGNAGRVLDTGLWRYTRHPNYFGEAVLWWGLACFALATGAIWTLVGPALLTLLLLKVSGVSLLEQNLRESRPAYADYVRRTSAFVPWPPAPAPAPPGSTRR